MSDKEAASVGGAGDALDRLYTPQPGELQLTARAVIAGCMIGGLIAAMNIYFGLKTGWSIGGSLIAAILGYALFYALPLKRPFTRLEANIVQTAGSGAGSMTSAAGLLAAIPALGLMGRELGYAELTLWGLSVAFLGVFFAVPLRAQLVVQERLRFPIGTATANTLMAMFSEGQEALMKARALLWCALGAGAFTLAAYFIPPLQSAPLEALGGAFALAAGYGFKLYLSPLMTGAGILIGMRVTASLALGAIVAWALIAPGIEALGWVEGPTMSYTEGARGWLLWPGVAIMVADALTSLGLSLPHLLRRRAPVGAEAREDTTPEGERIGALPWAVGMGLASISTITLAQLYFQIPWWMTLIALLMSGVLAMIATRAVGETNINPTSGMGKVTQLVFGLLAPGVPQTNLMAAAITSAGASQSGDMMQDLKAGHLLGASPKRQLIAQCFGVLAGVLFAVPIYKLFGAAYQIGEGDEMPAPGAHSWRAMSELLAHGLEALPSHAEWAILAGLLFGASLPVIRASVKGAAKGWVPSSLAFGIAFIVPPFYALAMFGGASIWWLYAKRSPEAAGRFDFAVASGLLAGEGLMGIVTATLTLLGFSAWV